MPRQKKPQPTPVHSKRRARQSPATAVAEQVATPAPDAPIAPPKAKQARAKIIAEIEKARESRVISYICGDRPGAPAQIGDDAVRPMYDVLRAVGRSKKIDLFLYSRGGAIEVPWRVVSMLREYCDRLAVVIPFCAHSAATLIAIGCDEIVMSRKAELGPIDPALKRVTQEGGSVLQEDIRVEDVMSYLSFLKDKAGLNDQKALADQIRILGDKLSPWMLGTIYRTHSHIRSVATKMLTSRVERLDEDKTALIVQHLAERIYSHNHAITRQEAKEFGLPVVFSDETLEASMWALLSSYEDMMDLRRPVDAEQTLGPDRDEAEVKVLSALIESREVTWAFRGNLKTRRVRQASGQININVNLGVALPEGLPQEQIPQEILNQLLNQVRDQVPDLVRDQTRRQSAIVKIEARFQGAYWQDVTAEGI